MIIKQKNNIFNFLNCFYFISKYTYFNYEIESFHREDDDEDEDDDVPIKQKRMGDFFNTEIDDDIDGSTRIQRHVFYEDARLSQLTTMF